MLKKRFFSQWNSNAYLTRWFSATGGSAMQAVQVLLDNNVREDRIIFLNLISAPEGIDAFVKRYPQIKIITGEIDGGLDDNKYIVPGVGDFGCR
jgi:uracil phosphoribosyltransferase